MAENEGKGDLAKDITCANFAHMGADADQTYNTTLTQSVSGRLPQPLTGPRNDKKLPSRPPIFVYYS